MTIAIALSPEVESKLTARARDAGMDVPAPTPPGCWSAT